nr:MAG TPA: hypothetical protein [Caudoviricetes sp.]
MYTSRVCKNVFQSVGCHFLFSNLCLAIVPPGIFYNASF